MNSQSIEQVVISPSGGSDQHSILKEHEAIRHKNGTVYNKTYWALVEKYQYNILSSSITIKDMVIRYDMMTDHYILNGNISMVGDKVSTKKEGYYYDDGSETFSLSGWSDYTNSVRGLLYIGSVFAGDLGILDGLINRSFSVDLGSEKPTSLGVELRCEGVIESTKPDISDEYFDILVSDLLANDTITVPDFTVIPDELHLDDIGVDARVVEKSHTNKDIGGIDWKWIYRLSFNSGILISGLTINYLPESNTYSLSGTLTSSYSKATYVSSINKEEADYSNIETNEWTDYDDSQASIKLMVNEVTALDINPILSEESISSSFEVEIGSSIPSDLIVSLSLSGDILSTVNDKNNESFNLNPNTSSIFIYSIDMTYKTSQDQAFEGEVVVPKANGDLLPTSDEYIEKKMAIFDGWRYMVGVRDVEIRNKTYELVSDIITKKLETSSPIKKIVLYSNEIIPDEFVSLGLTNRNSWIKYYISINDTDWHQISPMHHNQIGNLEIPPKIYEINSKDSPEEKIKSINKGYINSPSEVYAVRLKITLSRPEGMENLTPIIEDYALKCIIEEEV
jgi:hypothetical protein